MWLRTGSEKVTGGRLYAKKDARVQWIKFRLDQIYG